MSGLPQEVWDGNGGKINAAKATQSTIRDLLVALHVKVDEIIIPTQKDHEKRLRRLERFMFAIPSAAVIAALVTTYYYLTH